MIPEITSLKGVGPAIATKLAKLKITRVIDLLFHLPLRYQDRTHITAMGSLIAGRDVVVEGEIINSQIRFGRRRSLVVTLGDGSGSLLLRFFHFNKGQQNALATGRQIRCFGAVRLTNAGFEMAHPEYLPISDNTPPPLQATLTPIYPTTDGLNQKRLRQFAEAALTRLDDGLTIQELLPQSVIEHFALLPLAEALKEIHQPHATTTVEQLIESRHPAQQRLIFEELLAHQVAIRQLRAEACKHPAPAIKISAERFDSFQQLLPFSLTAAQLRVIQEIQSDLSTTMPMQRLIQGDVGSGKTVVAAAAAIQVINSGLQCAVMAPTELLAYQHYQSFANWLTPLGIVTTFLSGRQSGAERKASLQQIADGSAHLVVGTHALFQSEVQFARLGLSIIDEQHRFGVHQRLALLQKGAMAATVPTNWS